MMKLIIIRDRRARLRARVRRTGVDRSSIEKIVRDQVNAGIARGDLDRAMRKQFSLRPLPR